MVLEHLCFRSYLNPAETLVVREWYRSFYTALGTRIAERPQADTAVQEVFGSSPSLCGLAALGDLVVRAEQHGLGLLLDG